MGRLSQQDDQTRCAVRASEGWLALGAAQAALQELAAVEPGCRQFPIVLHQAARVLVALGRLAEARATIHRLARMAPERRLALLDDPALDAIWQ